MRFIDQKKFTVTPKSMRADLSTARHRLNRQYKVNSFSNDLSHLLL